LLLQKVGFFSSATKSHNHAYPATLYNLRHL
jgi:hypothetical protein